MIAPSTVRNECTYHDIVYVAGQSGVLRISHESAGFNGEYPVLCGGERPLTIALPKEIDFETCAISAPPSFSISARYKRTDFFDFFNLKSRYDSDTVRKDPGYREKLSSVEAVITFFVTYRCTYKCPFCWQRQDTGSYARVKPRRFNAQTMASVFNRLKPGYIGFTGGEPTMYKDLFVLMNNLDPAIKIAMTSNLGPSFDVNAFIKFVRPEQCRFLGFSYHPSETTEEQFLRKLDKILDAGFQAYVPSVLYGPDLPRLLCMRKKLAARNVVRKYDRCTTPHGEHLLSNAEQNIVSELKENSSETEIGTVKPVPVNKMWNKQGTILCPAGHKSFHIDPLGDIYCCMSALDRSRIFGPWALPHYQPIGSITDPLFTCLEKPVLCWEAFRCSACDFVRLQEGWHFFGDERPPLPE